MLRKAKKPNAAADPAGSGAETKNDTGRCEMLRAAIQIVKAVVLLFAWVIIIAGVMTKNR